MASVSVTEAETMLKNASKLLVETKKFGNVNSANFDDLANTYRGSVKGDFAPSCLNGLATVRAGIASALSKNAGRALLDPVLRTYAQAAGFPQTDPPAIVARIFDYFVANAKSLKERNFTFGSVSAGGGNAGTGLLKRLIHDEEGNEIEFGTPEAKTFTCWADQNSGPAGTKAQKHAEIFRVEGANRGDELLWGSGSGTDKKISGKHAGNSIIQNPSFERYVTAAGTAAAAGVPVTPTSLTGWTVSTIGNCSMDVDVYYRGFPNSSTTTSLRFTGNNSISQILQVNSQTFDLDKPYYGQIAVRRKDSCDGTLTFDVGATQISQAMSGLTNDVWAIVGFDSLSGTNRKKMWPRRMSEQDLNVAVTLASRTTGSVYLDDLILCQFDPVDGTWVVIVGGSTPFLLADTFTFTDSIPTDAIVQYVIARYYDDYLPAAASPTVTDP